MNVFEKIFGAKIEKKASAVASLMVQYVIGRPQHQQRQYEQAAREGYIENVVAYSCISRIAKACAAIDIKLFRGGDTERMSIDKHELLDLLYHPNPVQGDDDFFVELYSTFLIGGEVFVEKVPVNNGKTIKELWIHSPDKFAPVPGRYGIPEAYEYKVAAGIRRFAVDPFTGESDILQIKSYNPINMWRGLSAVDPTAYSIDQHNEGNAWNFGLLKNGARPSGAFVLKSDENGGTLSIEQYNKLREQIHEQMTGGKNAGRPIILEGGLDWKDLSLSPRDMDFIKTTESAARNIALGFGVPPILLGIPGDSTYNNISEAKLAFYEDTVLPLVKFVLAKFNHWLSPSSDLYFEADENSISALFPRRDEKRKSLEAVTYMTINEKRAQDGLDAVEGGDVILVEAAKVPLSMAGVDLYAASDAPPAQNQTAYAQYLIDKKGFTPERAAQIAAVVYED